MAKPPVSGDNISSDHLQTWILKVYIHCEGCKKKVFKVLQSIDGVYKTVIDSTQHKAIVTGSVKGETLIQKLLKSGKHAEILPESFEPPAATKPVNNSGSQKRKKKQKNNKKQNDQDDEDTEHAEKEKSESKDITIDENEDEIAAAAVFHGNGGKKKKNKNKMGYISENKAPQNGYTEGVQPNNLPADTGIISENNLQESVEKLNLDTPRVYATPYDVPPYHNYYPIPAYGMSYSTSYPSTESSYYTPPVYEYAQSHPSGFNSARPPPSYYGRSAFDDHDDEGGEGSFCAVM